MFYRFRTGLNRVFFDFMTRAILDTPPLEPQGSGPIIFTMLSHVDVKMYLVAIKSLYSRLGSGAIHILDDGSLNAFDRALLTRHLGAPFFHDLVAIDTGALPKGGCWERLLKILDLSRDHYVIQMDSDILTCGDVPDVLSCIKENRCFTLGTASGTRTVSLAEAARYAARFDDTHVQSLAEQAFARAKDAELRRYVRGSAGFAGFAKGAITRAAAEAFSREMEELLGPEKWRSWGSEQVTSNYLISNSAEPAILNAPHYVNHMPGVDVKAARLLHFIGSWRYDRFNYIRCARAGISALLESR